MGGGARGREEGEEGKRKGRIQSFDYPYFS